MCTLSVVRHADGYIVTMNRDERHDREPERPPAYLPDAQIIAPIDPPSGGTWIAMREDGHWGCLLNGYMDDGNTTPTESRGLILPALLHATDPIDAASQLKAQDYASFRLVIGSRDTHILWIWDGVEYRQQPFHASDQDRDFLTSSSWQQDEVIAKRTALWHSLPATTTPVPAIHYNRTPELESAPLMYRSYSRTQSITALTIGTEHRMEYWRVPDKIAEHPAWMPDTSNITHSLSRPHKQSAHPRHQLAASGDHLN